MSSSETIQIELSPAGSTRDPSARNWFAIACAAAVVAAIVMFVWLLYDVGGVQLATAANDVGETLVACIAAASFWIASRKSFGRMRTARVLIAASAASWGLGQLVWSVYEVGFNVDPFPSLADVGFLLALPLEITGVIVYISTSTRSTTRGRAIADGITIAFCLLFVAWGLGLDETVEASDIGILASAISVGYPLGDIVMATVMVLAVLRTSPGRRGTSLLLLAGFTSILVADLNFTYTTAAGSYSGTNLPDLGWFIGYLLIALAPWWPGEGRQVASGESAIALWQLAATWAGIAAVLVTSLVLAANHRASDIDQGLIGAAIGVSVLAGQLIWYLDSTSLLRASTKAEGELSARTALLNQVITHAPLGVARVGLDLRVIDGNPRLCELLHAPAMILIGSSIEEYLGAEELKRLLDKFKPMLLGEVDAIEGDSPARRADGTELWLHWSVTVVRKTDGQIDYFLAMYEDITARHQAEEAAAANLAGLERLNRLKSEFVSMVSHEFRTALTGIQGYSEVMKVEEVSAEEVKEFATDINSDAQRLSRMITEMLDLDRMEAGRISLRLGDVDLNLIASDAADRARVATSKHMIKADLDPALPRIVADSDRLFQVVSNLLSNAIKYSPKGGQVTVITRAEGGNVELCVRDQGPGIPEEFMGKLFGRYERYEANPKQQVIGTGLGLAIARQIIEMHKGRIWAESKLGIGSEFRFSLPVGALGVAGSLRESLA